METETMKTCYHSVDELMDAATAGRKYEQKWFYEYQVSAAMANGWERVNPQPSRRGRRPWPDGVRKHHQDYLARKRSLSR